MVLQLVLLLITPSSVNMKTISIIGPSAVLLRLHSADMTIRIVMILMAVVMIVCMALMSISRLPIRVLFSLRVQILRSVTLILLMRAETVCYAVASRPGWCLRSLITLPYLSIAYSLLWQK